MHFLDSLSEFQKKAVLHTEGPLLIVAGAGAGKTKTITARIAHIIENGTAPEAILAVTFTNKAAKEMRERVHLLLGNQIKTSPVLLTFHALGVSILREFGGMIGLKRGFTILDEDDALILMKQAVLALDLSPKEYDPKYFRSVISKERQDGVTEESYKGGGYGGKVQYVASVWKLYDEKKRESGGVDFDDLLTLSIKLLSIPEVSNVYKNRFKYIHVDEYQDVNDIQVRMMELMTNAKNNICVVGDADQTIYTWRGAKIEHILSFEKKFAPCPVVLLEENYRSTETILTAANEIVRRNENRVPKNLFTNKKGGGLITILECIDEGDEARAIVNTIKEKIRAGEDPNNIAVLYRANFQSRIMEEAFVRSGVPYVMLGTRFFERKEVKDVLAFIRASLNPNSLPDISRAIGAVPRGIGKTTLAKMLTKDKEPLSPKVEILAQKFYDLLEDMRNVIETKIPSEAIVYVIKKSGLEQNLKDEGIVGQERLENIREMVTLATNYDAYGDDAMMLFLEHAALYESDSMRKVTSTGVKLMTVHSAKGLEWDTVFVAGLEQDLFPHSTGEFADKNHKEEERRLMYVAVTRAKKELFLSYAQLRTIFGQKRVEMPSEFLYDIPDELKIIKQTWGGDNEKVVYLD